MRYLGIDWGVTHLGLSISDPEERIVFPIGTIVRTTWDKDLNMIKQIVEEKNIKTIVLGDPLRTDFPFTSSKSILKVKKKLETIGVRVILFDERYSTKEALKLQKILGNRNKDKVHEIASSIILKSFIDFISKDKKNIGK